MKFYNIEQYTDAWYVMRAGIPTASQFHRIITPTGKPSTQADNYANQMIAELFLQRPIEQNFKVYAMEWGHEHEKEAIKSYCLETGHDVIAGGFFTNDDGTIGASPDGRVFQNNKLIAICEIKCPQNPAIHVEWLLKEAMNGDYIPQVQGQLYVTDMEFSDWYTYHPEIPSGKVRVYRDDDFIKKIDTEMNHFLDKLEEKKQKLFKMGVVDSIQSLKIDRSILSQPQKNSKKEQIPDNYKDFMEALYGVEND